MPSFRHTLHRLKRLLRCAAPLLSLRMWWLSFAWLLIGATITNVIVWTPLLLDAALSGNFNGQLRTHATAPADPHAEVRSGVLPTFSSCPAKCTIGLAMTFALVIQAVHCALCMGSRAPDVLEMQPPQHSQPRAVQDLVMSCGEA